MHLVVIGAGISGLAAAWAAQTQACGQDLRITVLEAGDRVGGKAQSNAHPGGWLTESGPTGFLDNEPALDRLIDLAGLQKLSAQDSAARRFVVLQGKLREIHAHPLKFARSGLLSPSGLLRVLRERWVAPKSDESVWQFGARRMGSQAADRLLNPMVQGVFAGDAKQISLPAAFPRMAEFEREYGSLFKALGARRKAAKAEGKQPGGGPAGPGATLTSFEGGLQRLPQALAEKAPFAIECNRAVHSIERATDRRWALQTSTGPLLADGVVLATEGWATAQILTAQAPDVAKPLQAIPYPSVTVLSLGYGPESRAAFPIGFGCLIPRTEKQRALGFLWDSHIFPGRAPDGHVLVRALYGGAVDPSVIELSSEELLATARAEIQSLFGVTAAPTVHFETRWDKAIPQYNLGHLQRVKQTEAALQEFTAGQGPLELAGNALYGVAFGKAAARGWQAGESVTVGLQ